MGTVPIRRCLSCNSKTHKRFWIDDKICPVCSQCEGYKSSTHGGLTEKEIFEERLKLIEKLQQIEGNKSLTKPGQERHY